MDERHMEAERKEGGGETASNPGADHAEHPEAQTDEAPNKQHGDALQDGSGNRHGVHDPNERPQSC